MNAILSLNYHKDPQLFRVNELEDHAYFIPFADKKQTSLPRECSPFFHSLNGAWRFLWRPSVYEFQDFFAPEYDLSAFEEVTLPECWQTHGRDYAQYQASAYPFLADPPHVPEKNPVASYVKDFDIEPVAGKRYELHLEGKDSCAYVWLNGHFVGYGEVPHNDSAFDVTPYLQNGTNRLCVAVLKWCTGTYFDDQDKIRLSGIFRDVYILERAANGLRDLSLTADQSGLLSLTVKSGAPVRASVFDGERLLGSAEIDGTWHWQCAAPRLWSAEQPHLYDLVLECEGEVICRRFGFRTVAIKDAVFTVNGKPVKFYGVNRHDSAPDVGYAVSEAFVRAELMQMKQHNVNAIRTAHYPNSPYFYDLCDELGFYVMCEADQECHGMTYLQNWGGLVSDPLWAPCIHDRMVRMYQAFKNSPSVVIWSLGNESGWGENLNNEAAWFHRTDPTRPVHYEGAFNSYTKVEEEELIRRTAHMDFLSAMYPPLSDDGGSRAFVQASLEHPVFAKMPYVMCEYSHAMGNSCGDLRFYDEWIQKHPNFLGGYIWEWSDHALYLTDEKGKKYCGYGGDFGEKHHLHNVCMDGLVAPDRTPHSNLAEAKAVFAPVRVTRAENGALVIKNRYTFSDFSHLALLWHVIADNKTVAQGTLEANPAAGACVTLPCPASEPYHAKNAALTVTVTLKSGTAWASAGHTVAAFSFPLAVCKAEEAVCTVAPVLTEQNTTYTVSGADFIYTFRRDTGLLEQATVGGKALLCAPADFHCFRAYLDNDRGVSGKMVYKDWQGGNRFFGNIEYTEFLVHGFTAAMEGNAAVLTGDFVFGAQGRTPIARGRITYRVDGNGTLTVGQSGAFADNLPYFLPRYGLKLPLAAPAEGIRYYGYGPLESYEDKISHALLGEYDYLQDDTVGGWEKPQESGSHCYTEWLTLQCNGIGLRVSGNRFSFNATRFDIHDTAAARHAKDLVKRDHTDLYLDYRMSGVGSNSCGGMPPVKECRINGGETFDFAFKVEIL